MNRVITDAESVEALAAEWPVNDLPSVGTETERLALTAALGYVERNTPQLVRDEIRTLVSERDALAGRVAELESMEPAGWYSKQYGFCYMKRQPHMFEVGSILYLKDGRPAWRVDSKCSMTALMSMADLPHGEVFYLRAALSATTPESKP